MAFNKIANRARVRRRIRGKISGTTERPRLSVFRSNSQIYAQVIDDVKRITLVAASSIEAEFPKEKMNKTAQSQKVGEMLAKKAIDNGITTVVFDRGGYRYHGRVKALADGARQGGLIF